jgi:UDP-GlcNAc:undecaprenyl-phosphate GlcNAc-1-phosphate transferase
MYSLLFLACVSFALSVALTPVCRNLFRRYGLVDAPDAGRKSHARPVPKVGGVPIVLACAAAFGVLIISPLRAGAIVQQALPLAWKIMPAVALIFLTGLADDLLGLKPWQKLAGQFIAACAACLAGVHIHQLAYYPLPAWLSIPVTLLWLMGCANAFNLIDGVDGLAAGVGLFASVTTLVAALLSHNMALALATAPLVGGLLGFLRYNFNPATIFLGDSGSLLIGFVLGCYGVIWSQKSATLIGMTAPLMALAIPILDVALSILRRFLRGQPIFAADRGHIHHRLLDRGLTPRRVALLLYGVCGLFAAFSLMQSVFQNQFSGLILVLFCAAAWIGVQNLGYVEFRMARRLLFAGAFQNVLNAHLALRGLEESLAAARTPDECWRAVQEVSTSLGFDRVELSLGGERYDKRLAHSNGEGSWELRVPLAGDDFVRLACAFHSTLPPVAVGQLAEVLRARLGASSSQFHAVATKKPIALAAHAGARGEPCLPYSVPR